MADGICGLDTFIVTAALRSASSLPLSESFALILCSLYHKMHSIVIQLKDFVQLSVHPSLRLGFYLSFVQKT